MPVANAIITSVQGARTVVKLVSIQVCISGRNIRSKWETYCLSCTAVVLLNIVMRVSSPFFLFFLCFILSVSTPVSVLSCIYTGTPWHNRRHYMRCTCIYECLFATEISMCVFLFHFARTVFARIIISRYRVLFNETICSSSRLFLSTF